MQLLPDPVFLINLGRLMWEQATGQAEPYLLLEAWAKNTKSSDKMLTAFQDTGFLSISRGERLIQDQMPLYRSALDFRHVLCKVGSAQNYDSSLDSRGSHSQNLNHSMAHRPKL